MFDIRYHIASLVAVFLALAIGIILGTVIVDKGIMVDQQKALVEKLEKDFEKLRTENAKLALEGKHYEQYARESFLPLIKDRLLGKNVAVIVTSTVDDSVKNSVFETLKRAGATYSCITINQPWSFEDKKVLDKITLHIQGVQAPTVRERVLIKLADYYTMPPGDNKLLIDFSTAELIRIDVMPTAQPSAALIIGGSDGKNLVSDVDLVLIDRLKSKLRIVGTETVLRKTSYMNAYQRAGIPTVDDIDEKIGQISAIFALAGADGNFGIKPTANQLVPAMVQQ